MAITNIEEIANKILDFLKIRKENVMIFLFGGGKPNVLLEFKEEVKMDKEQFLNLRNKIKEMGFMFEKINTLEIESESTIYCRYLEEDIFMKNTEKIILRYIEVKERDFWSGWESTYYLRSISIIL